MKKSDKPLLRCLFALYCAALILLLFFRESAGSSLPYHEQLLLRVNLHPLQTIKLYLRLLTPPFRERYGLLAMTNLLGNLFLFLPMGLALGSLDPRCSRWYTTLLCCGGMILCVELLQGTILIGTCDIDDFLLNLTGAWMGYGLRALILHRQS